MSRRRQTSQATADPGIGWIEALFLACLIVLSVAAIGGGAYLRLRGVPSTDRFGTILGTVSVRGDRTARWSASGMGEAGTRAVVVAVSADDGSRAGVAPIDARGLFRLRLTPGVYLLRARAGATLLTPRPHRVLVLGGELLDTLLRVKAPATSASAAP